MPTLSEHTNSQVHTLGYLFYTNASYIFQSVEYWGDLFFYQPFVKKYTDVNSLLRTLSASTAKSCNMHRV